MLEAGKAEEPEKLGSWADIEVLKDGISWDSLQYDMPMPYLLSSVFRRGEGGARRCERARGMGEDTPQE